MTFKIETVIKKRFGRGIGTAHRHHRDYSSLGSLIVYMAGGWGTLTPYRSEPCKEKVKARGHPPRLPRGAFSHTSGLFK
ncbi:hypothetical protein F9L16_23550 [Agarivorans sp. B2Z047]|uniref:hypothetical protein n=1 Tax=Agarivorans sp. B2Z047 TaxID=2652721 RepID=UPI00128C2F10|nr:hypothetical protein [Agarivorans sp. B2Z047]MPW31933.1 hypothetical protein [Agarivorans sp. B2Z047]UQN41903.1 hypothetical protein LQZ07_19305 [Agarivorans sp. B2Z047]